MQSTSALGKGFLSRVPKVLRVELGVCLEPLLWRAVLVLLKICDEVIGDGCKIVLQSIVADKTLCPGKEAGAPLGCKSRSDGGINEPCRKKGVQFVKRVLEFRSGMENMWLTAIQGLDDACDVLLDVAITEGLIPMQFGELVNIEGTVCDILHRDLGHPVPTRENVLRKLQGLSERRLDNT